MARPNTLLASYSSKRMAQSQTQDGGPKLDIKRLRSELWEKENIIVISGAGTSTNAGIDDFKSKSHTGNSSQRMFQFAILSSHQSAEKLRLKLQDIVKISQSSPLGEFEKLLESLASEGRLRRHYTQNIDSRYMRCAKAHLKTVYLHGQANQLRCHKRPIHTISCDDSESLKELWLGDCLYCKEENRERETQGKRLHSLGVLRPNILLYGEDSPDETAILKAFERDLRQPVDAIIIVGTRLLIKPLRRFVNSLLMKVQDSDCLTVWVNKEEPKLGRGFDASLKYKWLGDCDDFASLVH